MNPKAALLMLNKRTETHGRIKKTDKGEKDAESNRTSLRRAGSPHRFMEGGCLKVEIQAVMLLGKLTLTTRRRTCKQLFVAAKCAKGSPASEPTGAKGQRRAL